MTRNVKTALKGQGILKSENESAQNKNKQI